MDLWVNEEKGKPGNSGNKEEPLESVGAALTLIPDGGEHRIGVVWPAKNIFVRKNVLYNPHNEKMIEFSGAQEALATSVFENMVTTKKEFAEPSIAVPHGSGKYTIEELESLVPKQYAGNMNSDPEFEEVPWHSGPIDMGTNPNWAEDLSFGGNLYSLKAKNEGCGHLARGSADLALTSVEK